MRNLTKQRAAEKRKADPKRKAFLSQHQTCWCCQFRTSTDIHEMTPGAGRRRGYEERCTWYATCDECHAKHLQAFKGRDSLAGQLATKAIEDPEHYDRLRVLEIKGRAPTSVTEVEVIAAAIGHICR